MTACVLLSVTVALASALALVCYVVVLSLSSVGRDVLSSLAEDAADVLRNHGAPQVRSFFSLPRMKRPYPMR